MFIRRSITSLSRLSLAPGPLRILSSFSTTASTSDTLDKHQPVRAVQELKEWPQPQHFGDTRLKELDNIFTRRDKRVLPRKRTLGPAVQFKLWLKKERKNTEKLTQRFREERHIILGCDLAAAHFLLHRDGKVKFWGKPDWFALKEDGTVDLPANYDPHWQLTEVDASGVPLYYEGIENFQNLNKVYWASFANNPHLNEWCIDKISVNFPIIQCLDISGCPNITDRALEPLHKLFYLKTLIVTDWKNLPSFKLACEILTDVNPNLTIVIKDAENHIKEKICTK